jgi:hypothetical protein
MEKNIISTKPLFEFSDIELKAIAFDYHETIRNYQTDLDLIRTELNRRMHSHVVATVSEQQLSDMIK